MTTMRGPITLSDVSNGHVEISSISGTVRMKSVTGPFVRASCGRGTIFYDGDFGSGGDYKFTTHSGDIEAVVPANTSADFSAHSMLGRVHNELDLDPTALPLPLGAGTFLLWHRRPGRFQGRAAVFQW